MSAIRRFEDIDAWQLGRELTRRVYEATRGSSFARDFGLRDQIQRASVPITSNIAEGFERRSPQDFARILLIARGSAGEVRSQLYAPLDLGSIEQDTFDDLYALATRISRATVALARHNRAHADTTREPYDPYLVPRTEYPTTAPS
ncbi:four helix bundle protein [Rubrivirga sp. IMCC45206]|uniref:four helix bundle protein n=1 Tax=Rubrivirga sp. IMCC45206 TaxID=3391614 RepID=UPI00398F8EA2